MSFTPLFTFIPTMMDYIPIQSQTLLKEHFRTKVWISFRKEVECIVACVVQLMWHGNGDHVFFLQVGIMLCKWKYNLLNEKTKDKWQEESYRPFDSARDHKECKDQRGLKAKLIFLGIFFQFSIYIFCLFVGECKRQSDRVVLCVFCFLQWIVGEVLWQWLI